MLRVWSRRRDGCSRLSTGKEIGEGEGRKGIELKCSCERYVHGREGKSCAGTVHHMQHIQENIHNCSNDVNCFLRLPASKFHTSMVPKVWLSSKQVA